MVSSFACGKGERVADFWKVGFKRGEGSDPFGNYGISVCVLRVNVSVCKVLVKPMLYMSYLKRIWHLVIKIKQKQGHI